MSKNWPTQDQDVHTAKLIMLQYANENNSDSLGLFELIINKKEKNMNVRLASWVIILAEHFKLVYGPIKGDLITRKVITYCLAAGHTIH